MHYTEEHETATLLYSWWTWGKQDLEVSSDIHTIQTHCDVAS